MTSVAYLLNERFRPIAVKEEEEEEVKEEGEVGRAWLEN